MLRHRLRARWLLMGSALFFSVFMLAACQTDTPYSTIAPEGTHAENIDLLLRPIAVAGLAVFIVVEGLLVYSVFRFQRRSNAMPVQTHGNTRIEILWTIAPAIILLVISVLTFRTQAINSVQPTDALRINVVGHQWWWEFKYVNKDFVPPEERNVTSSESSESSAAAGTQTERGVDLVTANDMYVPVGRDVTVVLDSIDVIHSFWIPRLAGKTDVIPNNTNYLTFRAEQEGVYRGQCAEFCGEAHALMRFRVIALAPEKFDQWMAEHKTAPTPPMPGYDLPKPVPNATAQAKGTPVPTVAPEPPNFNDPAAQGQVVFIKRCVSCHAIAGVPQAKGKSGPNLTYFGNRTTIAAGVLPNNNENLAKWLHDPAAIKPGNIMSTAIKPGVLSDQEISDLIAYLEGMKITSVQLPAER